MLLSSHILTEVESLADRVSIIRDGVVVESGTIADLRGTDAHDDPRHARADARPGRGSRSWATSASTATG